MGQAKQRGTYEERKAQAVARNRPGMLRRIDERLRIRAICAGFGAVLVLSVTAMVLL